MGGEKCVLSSNLWNLCVDSFDWLLPWCAVNSLHPDLSSSKFDAAHSGPLQFLPTDWCKCLTCTCGIQPCERLCIFSFCPPCTFWKLEIQTSAPVCPLVFQSQSVHEFPALTVPTWHQLEWIMQGCYKKINFGRRLQLPVNEHNISYFTGKCMFVM